MTTAAYHLKKNFNRHNQTTINQYNKPLTPLTNLLKVNSMNNRTEQDNDITLYTLGELETMMRILDNPNSTAYVPFNHAEINSELLRRQSE